MSVAIIGTGVMGCGWITQCALSGRAVHAYDANTDSLAAVARQCEKLAGKAADYIIATAENMTDMLK